MTEITNGDRCELARRAVEMFSDKSGHALPEEMETAISDLASDLMHLCDQFGLDPDEVFGRAKRNYEAEVDVPDDRGVFSGEIKGAIDGLVGEIEQHPSGLRDKPEVMAPLEALSSDPTVSNLEILCDVVSPMVMSNDAELSAPIGRARAAIEVAQQSTFRMSELIKAEYLESGCQASDVEEAVHKLMDKCGDLFESSEMAWSFLMEEPHENLEAVAENKSASIEAGYSVIPSEGGFAYAKVSGSDFGKHPEWVDGFATEDEAWAAAFDALNQTFSPKM